MSVTYTNKAVLSSVVIDKLSVVLDVPESQRSIIKKNIEKVIEHSGFKTYRSRYKLSARLYLNKNPDDILEVSADPKDPSAPFFRVEFNPAHGFVWDFASMVSQMLPGGYAQLIAGGECTRIDAAVDAVGANINDLLVTYPKLQKTKGWWKGGRIETLKLGDAYGETQLVVYDKVSQIKYLNKKHGTKIPIPKEDTTRFEVRKLKHYPLKEIVTLPNFFDGMLVAAYPTIPMSPKEQQEAALFLEVCRSRGAQDALKMIVNETDRNKHRIRLENCKLPWWNTDAIWKEWYLPAKVLLHPVNVAN